ncbi:MAG: hypothetical protein H6648_08445 [Caldilineae bacterium]|nr:hypothetical protein [Caldilineae bacterium]
MIARKRRPQALLGLLGLLLLLGPARPVAGAGGARLRLLEQSASGLILELSLPPLARASDLAELDLSGQGPAGWPGLTAATRAGEPDLPLASLLVALPPDAEPRLEILEVERRSLPDRLRLAPPAAAAGAESAASGPPRAGAYGRDAFFPEQPARIAELAWQRDRRLARLEIRPFRYNPVRGELLQQPRIRLALRFERPAGAPPLAPPEAATGPEATLGLDGVVNRDAARGWRASPARLAALAGPAAPDRPAAAGTRFRIGVEQDGIHRIDRAALIAAGMAVDDIDPRRLSLSRAGQPVDIRVTGEADGRFDPEDAIYFYGERLRPEPGETPFFGRSLPTVLGQTRYTDEQAYWLALEAAPGPRLAERSAAPDPTSPLVAQHRATRRFEDHRWYYTTHFTNDDTWLWYRIQPGPVAAVTETFALAIDAPAPSEAPADLRVELLAASQAPDAAPDHHVRFVWGPSGRLLGEALWDGPTRYQLQATLPQAELIEGDNPLRLTVLQDQAVRSEDLFLDWIEIDYDRHLEAVAGRIDFEAAAAAASRYRIGGFDAADAQVWDLSDAMHPVALVAPRVERMPDGDWQVEVQLPAGPRHVAASTASGALRPSSIRRVEPSDLDAVAGADYVIVSPRALLAGSQRLADYRASQGLRTLVVDIDTLYNVFNDGVYHPRAIRRFLAHAFARWAPPAPRYLVLVGDGHWNLHGYNPTRIGTAPIGMPPNLAWVDPFQGEVDSSNQLATLIGDDPLPDIAVGRIPVRNAAELDGVIDKIEAYEQAPPADWMRRHVFAVDNTPDPAGDFVALTERLIADRLPAGLEIRRRYLDDYADAAALKTVLLDDVNQDGALMLNYVGHGARERWTHEGLLGLADLPRLQNGARLPIVLSWTCLDGTWDFPNGEGMAESLLRQAGGGAVATFSPTGLALTSGQEALQRGLYGALFSGSAGTLADLAQAARLGLYASGSSLDLIDTYTVFGDPALRLPAAATDLPSATPRPEPSPGPSPLPGRRLHLPRLSRP